MTCKAGTAQLGLQAKRSQFVYNAPKVLIGASQGTLIASRPNATGVVALGRSELEPPMTLPRVEVHASSEKGLGLFAVDVIPAYTKILEDDALLSLANGEDLPQLWERYHVLPEQFRRAFEELNAPEHLITRESEIISKLEQRGYDFEEASKMARLNSRWQGNAIKTGATEGWAYSLFQTFARINHSCTPNAHAHYRAGGRELVYAIRDIQAGDEITIGYFDITMPLPDRQARAKSWGFQCSCPACSSGLGEAYEEQLSYLHRHLSLDSSYAKYDRLIDSTEKAISIALSTYYPWLVVALSKLYTALFHRESTKSEKLTKLRDDIEKALEWETRLTGLDSPSSQQKRKLLADFITLQQRAT